MIFVARQPIFDLKREVFAYELLFRSGPENFFRGGDGDNAARSVINDSLHTFGFDSLTSGRRAFINVTRRVILEQLVVALPPERTVVEVLETVEADPEVLERISALKQAGYLIALDDFVLRPDLEPLFQLADIVKIDLLATRGEARQEIAARCRRDNKRLLAEKVETHEELSDAVALGFELFQGYFFCRPEMITGRDIPRSKLANLRFLEQISRPELDFDGLEQLIKQEVALSVKLLRYLNSAGFRWRTEVTSIGRALQLLGEQQVKRWANLVAVTSLGDDKPRELLVTSLVRARFSELVGPRMGPRGRELDLFLLGLLSAIDALVDRPLGEVLGGMPISADIAAALTEGRGPLHPVYALVRACERAAWDEVAETMVTNHLQDGIVADLYQQSVEWADSIFAA